MQKGLKEIYEGRSLLIDWQDLDADLKIYDNSEEIKEAKFDNEEINISQQIIK